MASIRGDCKREAGLTWSTTVPLSSSSGGMRVMFSAKYQSPGLLLSRILNPYSKSLKFFIIGRLRLTIASTFFLSL